MANVTGNVTSIEGGSGNTSTASLTVQHPLRNCGGALLSDLATVYGGLKNAAAILERESVQALQDSISLKCGP